MDLLLLYSAVLLVGALLSARAARTAYSNAVLFLLAGIAAGASGMFVAENDASLAKELASATLFVVLWTDGMKVSPRALRACWSLPGRALLLGMPLTFGLIGVLAHFLLQMPWTAALLTGAVLSPTDPVFASALVGQSGVPERLQRLLNVESGLNDGLALPVVLVLLAWMQGQESHVGQLLVQVGEGALLGIVLPLACTLPLRFVRSRLPAPNASLFVIAIALLLYGSAKLLDANEYLAAFVGGIVLAARAPQEHEAFHHVGETAGELLKYAALLAFGALVGWDGLRSIGPLHWLFAAAAVLLGRPLPVLLVLLRSRLGWPERVAGAWFGPKGFASVVYGIIVAQSSVPGAQAVVQACAAVVLLSMVAHSTTDVPISRWLKLRRQREGAPA